MDSPSLEAKFTSEADNLVAGDANRPVDIVVRDRLTNTTTLLSVNASGEPGNGVSMMPVMAPDGRYIVFESHADNLVDGDTDGVCDVFLHDRVTAQTTRVSVAIAYGSGAYGKWDVYVQPTQRAMRNPCRYRVVGDVFCGGGRTGANCYTERGWTFCRPESPGPQLCSRHEFTISVRTRERPVTTTGRVESCHFRNSQQAPGSIGWRSNGAGKQHAFSMPFHRDYGGPSPAFEGRRDENRQCF